MNECDTWKSDFETSQEDVEMQERREKELSNSQ